MNLFSSRWGKNSLVLDGTSDYYNITYNGSSGGSGVSGAPIPNGQTGVSGWSYAQYSDPVKDMLQELVNTPVVKIPLVIEKLKEKLKEKGIEVKEAE